MELFTTEMRDWWKAWELRLVVLFSLLLQVMLVFLGGKRKSIYTWYLRFVVWGTYLTASWATLLAFGMLTSRLGDVKEKTGGAITPNDKLTAFWAPFLLLHLGGTDSITAYALEDNELWIRSLATLIVKTGVTCYIYFLALTDSPLAVLMVTMIVVGFTKYGERILSMYKASTDSLRPRMIPPLKSGSVYPRIMEIYGLKRDEGYHVALEQTIEIPEQEDLLASMHLPNERSSALIQFSYRFHSIFRILFLDLILKVDDLGNCRSMFMGMSSENAFEIIAIELNFMYDLFYTKGVILYTSGGFIRRGINLSLMCAVLVYFSMREWKNCSTTDICITYLLLGMAILLEIYSTLDMISSDFMRALLTINRRYHGVRFLRCLQLPLREKTRWSRLVGQFSLLHYSLYKKKLIIRIEKVQKHCCTDYKELRLNMKEWIYMHLQRKAGNQSTSSISFDATKILQRNQQYEMTWSTSIEFDQTILIWHIATELCYFFDRAEMVKQQGELKTNYMMCKIVSRYLIYLLIMCPSMLPTGIGFLRYVDTVVDAQNYFADEAERSKGSEDLDVWSQIDKLFKSMRKSSGVLKEECPSCKQPHKHEKSQALCMASHSLLRVETEIPPSKMKGGESMSVLFDACFLASQLNEMPKPKKWNLISEIWAEALLYAAYSCEGYEHSKRLSKGGELLSHVWLLLAHFGISNQGYTSEGNRVAKLLAQ